MRGPETICKRIRHNSHAHINKQPVHNPPTVDNLNTYNETEIVHIGRKTQNDCAVNISIGNREQRALWDSGAGRCVISFECYNRIHPRYKTELFPSHVKIKAANGTIIPNKGECDITFQIGGVEFTFPFLCSNQLSQQMILGLNFSKAYHIGSYWMPNDTLFLTLNGEPFAETEPINDLNALIFCSETTIIPPYSNGYIPCKMPIVKRKANLNKTCVFEPSYKHRSTYSMCNTYDGIVTITEEVVKSGSFKVVMTNTSNKHVKINNNQTLGMLRSCQNKQICSLHEIVTFEPIPQSREREETKQKPKTKAQKMTQIQRRR